MLINIRSGSSLVHLPCPFRPDGSVIEDGRVRTVSLCISPERTEARYDKIHLFDVQVGDAVGGYQESKFFEPGTDVVVAQNPFGNIGLMVCYDLRFPELALTLRRARCKYFDCTCCIYLYHRANALAVLLQARAMDSRMLSC